MNNSEQKLLYPDDTTPVLKFYEDYDSVYVGLMPFVKVENNNAQNRSSMQIIPKEELLKKGDPFSQAAKYPNVVTYGQNEAYPKPDEIAQAGKLITWKEIIENTGIQNYKYLNKALMTSIGAINKTFQRNDLLEVLNSYTEEHQIWHPSEGNFNYFTLVSIYNLLKNAGISVITVEDEFNTKSYSVDLTNTSLEEFTNLIDIKDYFIYSPDRSILFAIGWDYFFFFIAVNTRIISGQDIERNFEGFWADETTTHNWTWDEEDYKKLRQKEKKSRWKKLWELLKG